MHHVTAVNKFENFIHTFCITKCLKKKSWFSKVRPSFVLVEAKIEIQSRMRTSWPLPFKHATESWLFPENRWYLHICFSFAYTEFEGTPSCQNSKISFSFFPRHIAKCHQIYNFIESSDSIEQNKRISLEIKCRIARIEVDYSSWNLIYWQAVRKSNLPFLWSFDFSSRYFVC